MARVSLGAALLLGALAAAPARAQVLILLECDAPAGCECLLGPPRESRERLAAAALPSAPLSRAARPEDAAVSPPPTARTSATGTGATAGGGRTIALSAGAFENKPLTDPAYFPVNANPPGPTVERLVADATRILLAPAPPRIVNDTGLPPLPMMMLEANY